ncbi:MAG TPA: alpha/beta hydrolase [Candidatus Angelobacter sp.]|nr:alpha/beta hydrolase [Candidatus Angelobacter sp.]
MTISSGTLAASALAPSLFTPSAFAKKPETIDAAWYARSRRFAELSVSPGSVSRVAYVEHGKGPAALFIHGYPLNGFQWRGAIERLHRHRRCLAPDVMGLGFTETAENQTITPQTQVDMLAMFLDSLHVDAVDIVANDSGGLVAQLFVAKYPQRVRTLLLTNCDVDENNPPAGFLPFAALGKKGTFVDRLLVPQLNDKALARSAKGIGQVYTYPDKLEDETIETYFRPLVESPLKKSQVNQYAAALATNCLVPMREDLKKWKGHARMVWGLKDALFGVQWAEWLDRTLPGSQGVRRVEEANLFFPEEVPDLIAEEAAKLWATHR